MAIRQFKVNNTDVSIGLATLTAPGFMSPEDKLALDILSKANFEGGSITEITVHIEELQDITQNISELDSSLSSLTSTVQELKSKLDKYPEMHSNDNNTYAIKNSSWEIVCGENEAILVDNAETAYSLSVTALENGYLPSDINSEMLEEMKNLLGEELFNELSANSVQMLPNISKEASQKQMLQKAIEKYYIRKEENNLTVEKGEVI